MRPFFYLTLLLNAAIAVVNAQPKYVAKYGKVSLEELRMDDFPPDKSAPAVVLFDKARLNGVDGTFTRHVRIKILTTAGTSFANFTVRTPSRSSLDGTTFNLENNQVVETVVAKENIFKEEIVDGVEIFKVFFPNVRPGSVIDFRYSFRGLPYVWQFQEKIPVMYNELILEPTNFAKFKKVLYGSVPVKEGDNFKWIAESVPAFEEEPFMTHYSNFITHFKFDINSIGFWDVSSDWQMVAKRLSEFRDFGGVLRTSGFLNAKAKEIKSSNEPLMGKVLLAYKYIQQNMKWNGISYAFATERCWENFTKFHSGNSAEVNLLLTALLKKAGINAYPVAMSTRDNGILNPGSASLNSINYVACYVKDGDVEIALDATSPHLIPGILPTRCKNVNGFVVDKESGWFIDTTIGKSFSRKQFIRMKIDEAGTSTGNVLTTYEDYDFLDWVEKFEAAGSEETFANNLKSTVTDFTVHECKVTVDKAKLTASENITGDFTATEHVQQFGGEVLVNPFVFSDIVNPFKSEERHFPVDFVSTRKKSVIVSLQVPVGMNVGNVPESILLTPECGGAKFSYQTAVQGNIVNIKCSLMIERQYFDDMEYAALKNFFSEVNRKMTESIQLIKKT